MKKLISILCLMSLPLIGFTQTDTLNCEIYAPNTFSPNNDGVNDTWEVSLGDSCYTKYECKVYNRYGDVVWESFDPTDRWIGNVKDNVFYAQNEIYTYSIEATLPTESVIKIGRITLLR